LVNTDETAGIRIMEEVLGDLKMVNFHRKVEELVIDVLITRSLIVQPSLYLIHLYFNLLLLYLVIVHDKSFINLFLD
jgi:hypothetical protein